MGFGWNLTAVCAYPAVGPSGAFPPACGGGRQPREPAWGAAKVLCNESGGGVAVCLP